MSGDIEKENVVLQRFMWKDGNTKCEAGKLLFALTELTVSEQHTTSCTDSTVSSYLKEKGLVEQIDNELHLVDGQMDAANDLGNQISDHIGSEIEALPINKTIHFAPSIYMVAVPVPCFQQNDNQNEEK